MPDLSEEVARHYISCWKNQPIRKRWDKGPVWELPSSFCVLEFPPTRLRRLWTYATCGMSDPLESRPIELHLFSLAQSDGLVELLTAIAHYHRTSNTLGLSHTVNFGRPWLDDSKCKYGLISLPYLDGPEIEKLHSDKSMHPIHCLWLIPITNQEREYGKRSGTEALEEKFEQMNFDYADPRRESVV